MPINKVILNGKTIVDLTTSTVTEKDVLAGKMFHKADGTCCCGDYDGDDPNMSYVLYGEDGSEMIGVVVGEETMFTATAEDIRLDKTAGTAAGLTVGTTLIPDYNATSGIIEIAPGDEFVIPFGTDQYDYLVLQAIITLKDSVSANKVVIDNAVYHSGSSVKVSDVTKDVTTKSIKFNFYNETNDTYWIRYFTYY